MLPLASGGRLAHAQDDLVAVWKSKAIASSSAGTTVERSHGLLVLAAASRLRASCSAFALAHSRTRPARTRYSLPSTRTVMMLAAVGTGGPPLCDVQAPQ
jgi:hypothetical protein